MDNTQTLTPAVITPSPKYTLNKADMISVGKGILIGAAGFLLTAISSAIFQTDFSVHIGAVVYNLTPMVWLIWSGLVNSARKWLDGEAG